MEKHIQIIRTGIYKRPTLQITTLQQSGNLEIWQSRDNYKYDHKLLPQQTIIKKINTHLNSILLVHYKKTQTTRYSGYIPGPILYKRSYRKDTK